MKPSKYIRRYYIECDKYFYNPNETLHWKEDLSNALLFTYSEACKIQAWFYNNNGMNVSINQFEVE
jgi:hypothetical protein